jgi:hypothetical protein
MNVIPPPDFGTRDRSSIAPRMMLARSGSRLLIQSMIFCPCELIVVYINTKLIFKIVSPFYLSDSSKSSIVLMLLLLMLTRSNECVFAGIIFAYVWNDFCICFGSIMLKDKD